MSTTDHQPSHPEIATTRSPRRKVVIAVGIAVALVLMLVVWYQQALRPTKAAEAGVTITEGDSTQEIAAKLKDKDLIRSELAFSVHIRLNGLAPKFKAGRFALNGQESTPTIATELTEESKQTSQFTIREGLTQRAIATQLGKLGIVNEDEFADLKAKDFPQYEFLQGLPEDAPLEGFLFPETYTIPPEGTSTKDVATIMLDQFEQEYEAEFREQVAASGRSLYDNLIMASIIEEEVKTDEDRRQVAGVFENRIERDMRLDADATLRYGLDKLTEPLTKSDLDSDNEYNTRKFKGLPPTPISNPGLKAIEAALNPAENDYLFYFTARDGKTIYSVTLDEHESRRKELQ